MTTLHVYMLCVNLQINLVFTVTTGFHISACVYPVPGQHLHARKIEQQNMFPGRGTENEVNVEQVKVCVQFSTFLAI